MITILAILLIFTVLFTVAFMQYSLVRRLAGRTGITIDAKHVVPFVGPLLNTVVYAVLAVCVWAVFHRTTYFMVALIGIAGVFAVVTAPLTFLVPLGLDKNSDATIENAVRRWDGVTRSRRILLVALQLIPVAASALTFQFLTESAGVGWVLWVPLTYLVTWTLHQWAILDAYNRSSEERGAGPSKTGSRVLLPLLLGAAIAGPLVLLVIAHASHSAPMALAEQAPDAHIYAGRSSYSIQGGAAHVTPTLIGMEIQFADGDPTEVHYGWGCRTTDSSEIAMIEAQNEIQVFANACDRWHVFTINSVGERLDDSLRTRLIRHVGTWALGTLLIALFLFGFALWRIVPTLRKAKRIAGVVHRDELTNADQESIVEGILRLGELAKLAVRKGQLAGSGHIELELNGDRFKLPLPASVECADGEYTNGARVSLIGTFSSTTRGHRDASIPWPNSAFLVASEAASARETWLWRATRLARLSAMASVVALVMTYAVYIAHFAQLARFLR